jgi:hypothetical protein
MVYGPPRLEDLPYRERLVYLLGDRSKYPGGRYPNEQDREPGSTLKSIDTEEPVSLEALGRLESSIERSGFDGVADLAFREIKGFGSVKPMAEFRSDGSIYVNAELLVDLEDSDDDSQLDGIIAHEVSHARYSTVKKMLANGSAPKFGDHLNKKQDELRKTGRDVSPYAKAWWDAGARYHTVIDETLAEVAAARMSGKSVPDVWSEAYDLMVSAAKGADQ